MNVNPHECDCTREPERDPERERSKYICKSQCLLHFALVLFLLPAHGFRPLSWLVRPAS